MPIGGRGPHNRRLYKLPMRNADRTTADPHQLHRSTPHDSRRDFSHCCRFAVGRYRDTSVGRTHVRYTPSHRLKTQLGPMTHRVVGTARGVRSTLGPCRYTHSTQSNCWTESTVPSSSLRAPHLDGKLHVTVFNEHEVVHHGSRKPYPLSRAIRSSHTGSHPNRWAQVSYRNGHVGSRAPTCGIANCWIAWDPRDPLTWQPDCAPRLHMHCRSVVPLTAALPSETTIRVTVSPARVRSRAMGREPQS